MARSADKREAAGGLFYNDSTVQAAYQLAGSVRKAAEMLGISKSHVHRVITGESSVKEGSRAQAKMREQITERNTAGKIKEIVAQQNYIQHVSAADRKAEITALAQGDSAAWDRFRDFHTAMAAGSSEKYPEMYSFLPDDEAGEEYYGEDEAGEVRPFEFGEDLF